jgi:hypothetical protein
MQYIIATVERMKVTEVLRGIAIAIVGQKLNDGVEGRKLYYNDLLMIILTVATHAHTAPLLSIIFIYTYHNC